MNIKCTQQSHFDRLVKGKPWKQKAVVSTNERNEICVDTDMSEWADPVFGLTTRPESKAALPVPTPVPFSKWPRWAKDIADQRELPTDVGVGDTVERLLGDGGLAIKAILKAAGVACGCAARKDEWNQKYPYREIL